jgi:hypothetical protein
LHTYPYVDHCSFGWWWMNLRWTYIQFHHVGALDGFKIYFIHLLWWIVLRFAPSTNYIDSLKWLEIGFEHPKGVPAQSWALTLGNIHPLPLQGRGPTQTPNLVEPIPYKTVRYHFLRYLMLMVPFLRTPARFMWRFFIINKNLGPRPLF